MTSDVIVSGAGPVGLFLACELALAKCSVLVLEKSETPTSVLKRFPFGIRGLSAPSVEALDRRGLLAELELHKRLKNPHMTKTSRKQAGHFAGISFFDDLIDDSQWPYRLPSSPATNLISEMEELETVLTRRAQVLGVEIKRGIAVSGFQQTENGVTVRAGDRSFETKWLVGCDGARSVVRKKGGFEFAGTEPEFTGYSAAVEVNEPEILKPGRNLTATGMYLQSQPGYFAMIEFDGGAGHKQEISLERIQQVLRRISGTEVTLKALHTATAWTDRARQATEYRRGRVFLAGDAAHIHSPLGGQGLNLGLGDAMNLGWKLAAAVHGDESLLGTYQSERHPLGEQILDWSRAQVAIMRPGAGSRALNAIVRDIMETRDGTTYFAGRVRGVNTRYDLGDDHPLVGRSVPNFEFEDGTKVNELMRDGRGLAIDFDGSLANFASYKMKYVPGRTKENFGLRSLLVRPDGIVSKVS